MAVLDRIKSLFKRAKPQLKPEEEKPAAKDAGGEVPGISEGKSGATGE